jgi:hypothetical protein
MPDAGQLKQQLIYNIIISFYEIFGNEMSW